MGGSTAYAGKVRACESEVRIGKAKGIDLNERHFRGGAFFAAIESEIRCCPPLLRYCVTELPFAYLSA